MLSKTVAMCPHTYESIAPSLISLALHFESTGMLLVKLAFVIAACSDAALAWSESVSLMMVWYMGSKAQQPSGVVLTSFE